MKESEFQAKLIKELENRFPNCIVLKNDPNYKQGMPDLTVLYRDNWAFLECKASESAHHQPNQEYYIRHANDMSFAAFIYPENKEEVLNAMEEAFRIRG